MSIISSVVRTFKDKKPLRFLTKDVRFWVDLVSLVLKIDDIYDIIVSSNAA